MNRRDFIRHTTLITASLALAPTLARAADGPFPTVRTPLERRKFTDLEVPASAMPRQMNQPKHGRYWRAFLTFILPAAFLIGINDG